MFIQYSFGGTDRQIKAMRNKVNAGTIVSGWITDSDTLTGSITAKEGQSLRIFAAAPVNGKLDIEITSPSGTTVSAMSFINDGDYAIINNCEAGTYTVKVTTPVGFDGRITVEAVVSSFEKAITAVNYEKEAVVNCNKATADGNYFGTVNLSISESAGIGAGAVSATLDFDNGNLTAVLTGFGDGNLEAGKALNGVFTVLADPNTPSGTYKGTLKVYFDASLCDPVFLSLASTGDDADNWSISGDKVVYTGLVDIIVDVTAPVAPEFSVADGKDEGTIVVTGNAQGATFVVLNFESDFEDINDDGELETYTARNIAAILDTDADGNFAVTLSKPQLDSRISAMSVNAAGGTSKAAGISVTGYIEPQEENEESVNPFTSVNINQVNGTRDVEVTALGAQISGLTVDGSICYRVVDNEPTEEYTKGAQLDTADWINAGAVTSFTVKNVHNGQYIELAQVLPENIYAADDSGNMLAIGVRYVLLRYSSAAVNINYVPGYNVSGVITSEDIKADIAGSKLILTNSADRTVTYTVDVQAADSVFTYAFTDVISGTYILSVDSKKVEADDIVITITDNDIIRNIEVKSSYIPGDINDDGKVNNKDLTRLFQYLSDWDVTVNSLALDVNGDGKVNNKDLTRLFQYLSDWDVKIY